MTRGIFISIDGPNGVGKSSVATIMVDRLKSHGLQVLLTSEPTKSSLGDWIRNLESEYSGYTYACLIAADRYFHLENEILPAIRKNISVVTVRYVESSLVLQRLDGLDINYIWDVNKNILIPDLSIVLTASAETLQSRLSERDTFSRFEEEFNSDLELAYYLDAAEFLLKKGFNVLALDNDRTSIDENVAIIVSNVLKLVS